MPSFSQYLLESNLCLLLLAGFYHLAFRRTVAFRVKRWHLQGLLIAAAGLPFLSFLFAESLPAQKDPLTKMAFENLLAFEIPDCSLSLKTTLLAVFFAGFAVRAFRLMDLLWDAGGFLRKNNNRPRFAIGWQSAPTACFSQLLFAWNHWDETEKQAWTDKWLPMHPMFGWEFFVVEFVCALNWWNPLFHWYRQSWKELYRYDFSQNTDVPVAASKLASGLIPLTIAASLFIAIPAQKSPTLVAGQWLDDQAGQIIYEHKKPVAQSYSIEWGDFLIPLKKYANPNGFEGILNIELTDFQRILKKEIKIFRGTQLLKPGTLSVIYRSGASNEQAYINDINPEKIILKDRRKDKIYNDKLGHGDELTLFGETEDIYLSRIQISIIDPKAGYEPVVNVPEIDHHDAEYSFQIVGRTGKRALVKLDSEHPNALHILDLYQDSSRYEIVKIPGFRTNRRYMTENEALLSKISAAGFDLAAGLPDVNYLPEYQDYQNQIVNLHWGELEAAPSSENYSLPNFTSSTTKEPELWIGEKKFKLEAFEIIISGKQGISVGYHTDRLDYLSLRQTLSQIQPETSVYFDRIVLKDQDGVLKLFPAAFAFHIGRDFPEKKVHPDSLSSSYMIIFGNKTEVMEIDFKRDSLPFLK